MLEPKRIKAVLFHPLSQGLGVSSLSLGVLLWLPGFNPAPAPPSLQVLVERCAGVPNHSIVIDEGQFQALLQLPPGANQEVIQIVGQTSFCRLSDRLFYGQVVTPQAFPLVNSTKVALILYDKNNAFAGVEQWDLPVSSGNSHQVFTANLGGYSPGGTEGEGLWDALKDLFFGSKTPPAPYTSPVQYQLSNPATCQ